jgi:hypothetical protein
MGELKSPAPVQLVVGLITHPKEGFERVRRLLTDAWGPIDLESPVWPFAFTDYYEKEMGGGLLRQFVAFERLVELDGLHRVKLASNRMEAALAADSEAAVRRPVNIDPGYVCHSKLVLFSTKDFSHRIYVAEGIFAESTLEWRGREFVTHPWTFPDYRTDEYRSFFAAVRSHYARKLKEKGGAVDI